MTAPTFQPPGYTPSRRSINPVIFIGIILLAIVLLGGGMAWLLGMGPIGPGSTNSPGTPTTTAEPTAPATAGATSGATSEPTAGPSGDVVPSPTVVITPGPPTDDTERLLLHVPEALRGTCIPGGFAEPVLASVDCTPSTDVSVSYALYANATDVADAYDRAFARAEIDRDSGRCYDEDDGTFTATTDAWPSEHEYTSNGEPIGRFLCDVGDPPSITWTDDRLYILAVATSPTGDSERLVSFWATEAGPIP
jgi:hypothetical protein